MCQDQEAFQGAEAGPEGSQGAIPERTDPGLGPGQGADPGGGQGQGLDQEEEGATDPEAGVGADHTEETGLLMDTDYMLEVS